MNEDLHIEIAARLADKPGAENLATERARKFVADALAQEEEELSKTQSLFVRKPVYAWGGVVLAIAACIAVAVVLFHPAAVDTGYGIPAQWQENQSSLAGSEDADTTAVSESSDTLAIEGIILPE